jgi:hypothetical protein
VGPRAVLNAVVKRKIPTACRESNPRTPIVQPIAHKTFKELDSLFFCNASSEIEFRASYTLRNLSFLAWAKEHHLEFECSSEDSSEQFIIIFHRSVDLDKNVSN